MTPDMTGAATRKLHPPTVMQMKSYQIPNSIWRFSASGYCNWSWKTSTCNPL